MSAQRLPIATDPQVRLIPRPSARLAAKLAAEALGTFAIVFAGCGAIMSNEISDGAVTHVGISLTFGLVVMAMIYAAGHISGAHFNPAVTIAFAVTRRFPWREVPAYILSQCMGAILGALVLRLTLGDVASLGMTQPFNGLASTAFIYEALLTFLLMFVICAVATDSRAVGQMAGMVIGATVALEALFAGPICGASMNPARSLGPALIAGNLTLLWVYLLAPTIGAIAGALTYQTIRCEADRGGDVNGCC